MPEVAELTVVTRILVESRDSLRLRYRDDSDVVPAHGLHSRQPVADRAARRLDAQLLQNFPRFHSFRRGTGFAFHCSDTSYLNALVKGDISVLKTLEHHESVTSEDLERFSTRRNSLSASIYIPTHRKGVEVQQDPIRLKNAVSEARRQLVEFGMPENDADSLLEPASELAEMDASNDFWQHQSDGLVLLLNAEEAHLFQLPFHVAETVSVSDRFFVKPLIQTSNSNEEFHLIACSRNEVRVFRGCRRGLVQEHFDDLPSGIEDVTSSDQQKGHNRHSFKIRPRSSDSSVPHGHAETNEEEDLRQYFRDIKDVIGDHLRAHEGPVIFAGVKELMPYFQGEFDCCTVLDTPASGNADHLSNDDLLNRSWPIVEQWLNAEKTAHLDRFREASGTDYGSTDLSEILPAAFAGRIETLILKSGLRNYGTCDEHGSIMRHNEDASAETYDLFDIAAIKTLSADGKVVFVDDDHDCDVSVAAIFRYTK